MKNKVSKLSYLLSFFEMYWHNFWFKYNRSNNVVFGKRPTGHYTFRKQRLFNILILIVIFLILFYGFNFCSKK